jgi:flavin-binding protein dodecin
MAKQQNQQQPHVYKIIDLTGTSSKSIEDAVQSAITIAGKTVRNMSWFEVVETRGAIRENEVYEWQVTLKIGFRIEG